MPDIKNVGGPPGGEDGEQHSKNSRTHGGSQWLNFKQQQHSPALALWVGPLGPTLERHCPDSSLPPGLLTPPHSPAWNSRSVFCHFLINREATVMYVHPKIREPRPCWTNKINPPTQVLGVHGQGNVHPACSWEKWGSRGKLSQDHVSATAGGRQGWPRSQSPHGHQAWKGAAGGHRHSSTRDRVQPI